MSSIFDVLNQVERYSKLIAPFLPVGIDIIGVIAKAKDAIDVSGNVKPDAYVELNQIVDAEMAKLDARAKEATNGGRRH